MYLSYNWLKQLVNFSAKGGFVSGGKEKPEELAEFLTSHISNVESIKKLGQGLDQVIVAQIMEVKPHPNADRLQIAIVKSVENRKEKILNIVCGASNIKVGQKVPLALIGAKLSGGLEIKESIIRGIKSEGMLCAEDELGLGDDHTGIMILDSQAKIGQRITEILGLEDAILDLENKPLANRPDLFSHYGVAKEISIIKNLLIKNILFKKIKSKNNLPLHVRLEAKNSCPRYMAITIEGIKIKPSPSWLQRRLRALGLRPINNIVDITNYILLELGQPLHAFDYDLLENHEIIIREAKTGEKTKTLDGIERSLEENDLLIADPNKSLALAGIMGGEGSGINEKTKNIVIESANFNPVAIRKTSHRLALRTEAATRFEKGLPIVLAEEGLWRAVNLILEMVGGKVGEVRDLTSREGLAILTNKKYILADFEYLNRLIGCDLPDKTYLNFLKRLGIKLQRVDLRKRLISIGKSLIGATYQYGASTFLDAPKLFDCSSLARYLYRQLGIELPRLTIEQIEQGEIIDNLKTLKIGDLLFTRGLKPHINEKHKNGVGHVGIFWGKNKVLHASSKQRKVVIENLNKFIKETEFRGAHRILSAETGWLADISLSRVDLKTNEDLAEEIVKICGLDNLLSKPATSAIVPLTLSPEVFLNNKIKNLLAALGFDEIYSVSFIDQASKINSALRKNVIPLLNPLAAEIGLLRFNMMFGLESAIEKNIYNYENFRIFELGRVFFKIGQGVRQPKVISGLINEAHKNPFAVIKGVVEQILNELGINNSKWNFLTPEVLNKLVEQEGVYYKLLSEHFDSKDSSIISVNDQPIGVCGLLSNIPENKRLKNPVYAFELNFDELLGLAKDKINYSPLSPYQSVSRDFSFLFKKDILWQEIQNAIKEASPLIKEVKLFDIFQDEKFGDKKSFAFSIELNSDKKTLEEKEINGIQNKVIEILKQKFSAEQR